MKYPLLVILCLTILLTAGAVHAVQLRLNADALSTRLDEIKKLPPLPEGVSELKFADLYQFPVGPRGLELTDKVRALAGKRVRVLGFMVRQARSAPGLAMLSPYELATNENEYGLAEDLPPGIIFVEVSKYEDISVPYTPGILLLTGTLEVGRREESDGRFSEIRLRVEQPPAAMIAPTSALSAESATAVSPSPSAR